MSEIQEQTSETTATVVQSYRVVVVARFVGPSNTRGARIRVRRGDHRVGEDRTMYVGWDHALGLGENYAAAIGAYLEHMGWDGEWWMGGTTDGYVAVQVGRSDR